MKKKKRYKKRSNILNLSLEMAFTRCPSLMSKGDLASASLAQKLAKGEEGVWETESTLTNGPSATHLPAGIAKFSVT